MLRLKSRKNRGPMVLRGAINEWMAQVHWLGTSWRKCQKCNAIPPRTKSHVYVQVACNVRRHGDTQVNEWTPKRKKFNWNLTTKSSGGFKFWRQIWKISKNDLEGYTHAYTPTHTHIVSLASFRPDESLRNNFLNFLWFFWNGKKSWREPGKRHRAIYL